MAYYEINTSHNKIEIYFDSKPSVAIRDFMKSRGFRWNSYERYWFSYYSSSNVEVAQQVCAMANDSDVSKNTKIETTSISTVPNTKPVIPAPDSPLIQQNHFEEDELVVFNLNGTEHIGEVWSYTDMEVTIWHIDRYENGFGHKEISYIPINDVTKCTKYVRSSTSPRSNTIVDFESDDGSIIRGLTQEDHYTSIDIIYFEIDDKDVVHRNRSNRVDYSRILNTYHLSSYLADFLPFKEGERVEYVNDDGKVRTGKIVGYTLGYEKAKVEYVEVDEWKDKWIRKDYVCFGKITKLSGLRRKLIRSEYINDISNNDIEFNKSIKTRIQARDDFSEGQFTVSKKPLFKHQKAGCILAEKYNKFAFFYDTGTGKTVMALNIIQQKEENDRARFLIIAPKSIIKTAWLDDASNFFHLCEFIHCIMDLIHIKREIYSEHGIRVKVVLR